MQCFCSIVTLISYFKSENNYIENIIYNNHNYSRHSKQINLTKFPKTLIENLYPEINNKYLDKKNITKKVIKIKTNTNIIKTLNYISFYFSPPENDIKLFSMINNSFNNHNYNCNPSEYLINFIITRLHNELNNTSQGKYNFKNLKFPNNNTDSNQQRQIAFNNYIEIFKKNNNFIISNTFTGNYVITQICSNPNCRNTTYNFETFNYIVIDLEEVRNFKIIILRNKINEINEKIKSGFIPHENFKEKCEKKFSKFLNLLETLEAYEGFEGIYLEDCSSYIQLENDINYDNNKENLYCKNCGHIMDIKKYIYSVPVNLVLIFDP